MHSFRNEAVNSASDQNDIARIYLHSSQFLHPKHPSIPVEINRLALEPLQLEVIQCIYSEQCEVILTFSDSAWDQKDVQDYLTSHLLNHSS